MHDIKTTYKDGNFDIDINEVDAEPDNTLRNPVLFSILGWDRDDTKRQGGYWANGFSVVPNDRFGSLLWSLRQNSNTNQNRLRMAEAIRQGLFWMIEDSVARDVTVEIESVNRNSVTFRIKIQRFTGEVNTYDLNWEATERAFSFKESV